MNNDNKSKTVVRPEPIPKPIKVKRQIEDAAPFIPAANRLTSTQKAPKRGF